MLYVYALIPLIVGLFVWRFCERVHWVEWIGGSVFAFILAGAIHGIALSGMISDREVWSGEITHATFYPEWIEEYTESHTTYSTDSDGNTTSSTYYTTEHRTHEEYWEAYTDLDYSKTIDKDFWLQIVHNFKNRTVEQPGKSGFDGGDENIYVAYNRTGYVYPVTAIRSFENRVKAAPTVFSFPKVPETVNVHEYPYPSDWLCSNRLINESRISIKEFDRFNTRLGFKKRVNIIMINFGNADASIAQYQQAKYIGGKKNDLVICYGGASNKAIAEWSYCFGWTEKDICKRNIETILLEHPVNNSILPILEKEIIASYNIKDWSKFDYITIEPKPGTIMWYFIIMVVTQIGLYVWFYLNELNQGDSLDGYRCGGNRYWR